MAVAVDATATAVTQTTNTSTVTVTNMTVGSGATALLAWFQSNELPTSITANWDNAGTPQAMTLLATQTVSTVRCQLYGLLAPHVGNLNLVISWTGTCSTLIDAISFTGTATDLLANAFTNAITDTQTGDPATLTVTSDTSSIAVVGVCGVTQSVLSVTATGSTQVFTNNSVITGGGARAPGAATVAFTADLTASATWGMVGVSVSPPSGPIAWLAPIVSF